MTLADMDKSVEVGEAAVEIVKGFVFSDGRKDDVHWAAKGIEFLLKYDLLECGCGADDCTDVIITSGGGVLCCICRDNNVYCKGCENYYESYERYYPD